MASTISNINWSRVDQKVNAALRYGLPSRDLFSMRVLTMEESEAIQSDVVYVPFATDPDVNTKTLGTMGTASGALAGTSVTLSNPKQAAWEAIEGKMNRSMLANYWEDKIAGGMYVLSKAVLDAALAYITAANFGNVEGADKLTVAAADFGQPDLGLLWEYGAKKIKQRSRSLLLNAQYAGQLIGNSSLMTVFATANGTNPVETGTLPRLIGHQTAAYPDLPSNSESLGGAVFGQAALCVACSPINSLMDAGDGNILDRRVIEHAESGFRALYTARADAGGALTGEVALMYGIAKGQDAVIRIVSA